MKCNSTNNCELWANTFYVVEIPAWLCELLWFTLLQTRWSSYDCFLCPLPDLVCISSTPGMQLWITEHQEVPDMMSRTNIRYKNALKRGTMEDFMYMSNHIIMEMIQDKEENRIRIRNKTKKRWKRSVIRTYRNHIGVTRHMRLTKNELLPRLTT